MKERLLGGKGYDSDCAKSGTSRTKPVIPNMGQRSL
jgi:hypothetical protein